MQRRPLNGKALNTLRLWATRLKRDVVALSIAARDPRVPLLAKLVAAITAAYAFSPIDLIPDFIPILGLVDDLVILPMGIWLAVRLIPRPLMAEFREMASRHSAGVSRTAAAVIILLWVVGGATIAVMIYRGAV